MSDSQNKSRRGCGTLAGWGAFLAGLAAVIGILINNHSPKPNSGPEISPENGDQPTPDKKLPEANDDARKLLDIGLYIPQRNGARWLFKYQKDTQERFGSQVDLELPLDIGGPGELPVVGDFDGDGLDDIGVYLANGSSWVLKRNLGNGQFDQAVRHDELPGGPNEIPIVGDFDGDGLDDVGVYMPQSNSAHWVVFQNLGSWRWNKNAFVYLTQDIGGTGKLPIVGKFR